MIKLSVIIPAYKDPYLIPTIKSLLDNSELGDELEVIVVLDGFWPDFDLVYDKRVRYIRLGANRGMRGAINAGVRSARGKFLLRSDQHCMFAPGYDKALTRDCRSNWIMTATRFFLDPEKWEVMDLEPINYEKLFIQDGKKFSGQRWRSRDKERKGKMIDQTMAMQGSMWVMHKSWWEKVIRELQTEGYGQMYQDSHEMIFKTWKAGGKMVLNKNTWFAHKHRSFAKGRHEGTKENPSLRGSNFASGQYALKIWKDYYTNEILPKWFGKNSKKTISTNQAIKLNIGAGYKKIDGFLNIDCVQTGVTDFIVNIEKDKLPFEDNSVDEIACYETLEHLENLIFAMNEMWRVLKPNGLLKGKVPGTWAGAIADPTHKRIFVPETFDYFTGINPKHPSQPARPRDANYGIKPWNKINVDKGIRFELSPRK